jgi:uncharacterized damage-inducible protein DinB
MDLQDIATIFSYHTWANDRILTAALCVSRAQLIAPVVPDPGHGSLRGILVHMLDAERGWRSLVEGREVAPDIFEHEFPDVASIQTLWQAERAGWPHFIESLDDARLNGPFFYAFPGGPRRERILWQTLLHVVNHGMQHRSEAAAILTGYGHSPGECDFNLFLHEQAVR